MSYINDALRKAQKDKKSPYAGYEPILSAAPGEKTKRPRRWLFIMILILLLWAAGTVVLLYRPEEQKVPAAEPMRVARVPIAATAVAQPVQEKPLENKNEALLTPPQASPEMKIEPVITDSKKLYAQAFRKHQEGKLDEAKSLYKKVIKTDPRNVEALNNLGVVYMKKKVYKWAIIRLNDAIKIKYNYADAHYNLACIYAQQNDTNRSLAYLRNAIGFNPQVKKWAGNDSDLKALADLPEFKKLLEKN